MKIRTLALALGLALLPAALFAGGKREKPGEASVYAYTATVEYRLDALQSNLMDGNEAVRKDSYFRTAMEQQSANPSDAQYIVHISLRNVYSDPSLMGYGTGTESSVAEFQTKKFNVLTTVFFRITPGPQCHTQFLPVVGKLKTIKSEQQLGQSALGITAFFGQNRYLRDLYLPQQVGVSNYSSSGQIVRALVDENYGIFFQEMPDEIKRLVEQQ